MHPIQTISSISCLALLAACSTPTGQVVFVTKTSLGIDAEQTTPGVSVAYDRFEGYMAPRYDHSNIPPVYATFNTDGGIVDRNIKHTYATGKAAKSIADNQAIAQGALSGAQAAESLRERAMQREAEAGRGQVQASQSPPPSDPPAMFFGTTTTLGLKFGFTGPAVDTFVLGFKRKELAVIPQGKDTTQFPSVVAIYNSNVKHDPHAQGPNAKFGIGQLLATGDAAESVANNLDINKEIASEARALMALGEPPAPPANRRASTQLDAPITQASLGGR